MSATVLAVAGGIMIGLAASLLLWLDGRIAGVSGIVGGILVPARGDVGWRVAFVAGLVAAGGLYLAFVPGAFAAREEFPRGLLMVAGVLVGFGTRMGNGCTSGHGVCGLGRLAPRSIVAVPVFMVTAMVTTYLVRISGVAS